MADANELTFRYIVDNVLVPEGIKVGGFPEELFLELTEEEKDQTDCAICFMILNDARQCRNKHNFCASCIFAWSLTTSANSDKCPVCRSKGSYQKNEKLNNMLFHKRVQCPEPKCKYRGFLKFFLTHSHGFDRFNNKDQPMLELPVHAARERVAETLGVNQPSSPNPTPTLELMLPDLTLPELTRSNMYQFDIGRERQRRQARFSEMRGQLRRGRERLHNMMDSFNSELEHRRQSIRLAQLARESQYAEQMEEVGMLGRQLEEVASDLLSLLSTVSEQRAIEESISMSNGVSDTQTRNGQRSNVSGSSNTSPRSDINYSPQSQGSSPSRISNISDDLSENTRSLTRARNTHPRISVDSNPAQRCNGGQHRTSLPNQRLQNLLDSTPDSLLLEAPANVRPTPTSRASYDQFLVELNRSRNESNFTSSSTSQNVGSRNRPTEHVYRLQNRRPVPGPSEEDNGSLDTPMTPTHRAGEHLNADRPLSRFRRTSGDTLVQPQNTRSPEHAATSRHVGIFEVEGSTSYHPSESLGNENSRQSQPDAGQRLLGNRSSVQNTLHSNTGSSENGTNSRSSRQRILNIDWSIPTPNQGRTKKSRRK